MSSEPGGGDALLELRDKLIEFLWRVYGYDVPLEQTHPVTIDKYRSDADDVLDLIEAAGYVIVPAEQLLWLQKANYYGSRWAAENPLPGDLDPVGPVEEER